MTVICARAGGGVAADPLGEIGDLLVGQFLAFRGHLEIFIFVADGLDQEAFFGVAGDKGGARRAAFEQGVTRVEGEAAFGFSFGFAVTFVTGLDENGADF